MFVLKNKFIVFILLVLIIISSIIVFDIPSKIEKIIYKKEYVEYVEKYSKEYNVEENLIYAVIKAESNFNPEAKSEKNAIGIMQIMNSTAEDVAKDLNIEVTESKLSEVELNINIGTKYLSTLLQKYNNVGLAITAYNAGIGKVDSWIENGTIKADGSDLENIPYKETNNYVRKIIRDYKIYSRLS